MKGRAWTLAAAMPGLAVCIPGGGCHRDVRLSQTDLPHPTVRAISLYGLALDENATPEQVAFAALRAVRDDFLATTDADRKAALARQFDLCAAEELAGRSRSTLTRDEFIYHVVYRWTPTVAHYAHDLPENWNQARTRLVRSDLPSPAAAKECAVALQVTDPGGDPGGSTVIVVWLAKDQGFWRVLHLGFDARHRTMTARIAAES